MEQKLAEFRARRQAENAAKKSLQCPVVPTEAAGVRGITTCEREGAEEAADGSRHEHESSGSQVRLEGKIRRYFVFFFFFYYKSTSLSVRERAYVFLKNSNLS